MIEKVEENKIKTIIFDDEPYIKVLDYKLNYWLKIAAKNYSVILKKFNKNKPIINQILSNLGNETITIVLFSSTPLITKENLEFYVDYLLYKSLDVLILPAGYVFKTKLVKENKSLNNGFYFNGVNNEFVRVNNNESYNYVIKELNNRIITFHQKNNVKIINPNLVQIGPEVTIGSNTVIEVFNTLQGKTKIGENVHIKTGNNIINSKINKNSKIEYSKIVNSAVGCNCEINCFNIINNCVIANNVLIGMSNCLNNSKILKETKINNFNEIG